MSDDNAVPVILQKWYNELIACSNDSILHGMYENLHVELIIAGEEWSNQRILTCFRL